MRGKNLKMAYDYLYSKGLVHKQKEFADAIGLAEETVSRVFKKDSAISIGSVYKLKSAFPGIFNDTWLDTGEGDMLMKKAPSESTPHSDIATELLRMINDLREEVRGLKSELEATKADVKSLKRAHYGYASVAADGGTGIEEFEEVK